MMRARFAAAFALAAWQAASAQPSRAPASYKDLKFPPLRQIEIPNIERVTLPNGMKLYLLEEHELPLVGGFALVRTGNLFDPKDKIGLASITGTVIRSGGTKNTTGDQLDEKLENIAASVESSIGESSGRVSFSALKENADEVLSMFHDVLTGPEFRQDKVDLAKTQYRSGISRRNDDPHGIAQREFSDIIFGRDNPYGWREEYETIDRIKREDLIAFYKRYYFPANVMLAVHGDFSAAEMKAKLEKLFADWTMQQTAVPPFPKVTAKPAPGIYLAVKEDVTQTFFDMGHLGGLFRDKDYPALEVMGDILGGGFPSRLFQKVRTKLGYAYSVSAAWGANYEHPGMFQISGSTKSLSTTETFIAIREEIDRIRSAEVTDQELKTAKETVENSFIFNFDTRSKTLNRLVNYEYFGYPKDFIFQYQKAIAAVTKADVLRVAKQYLRPQDLVIVAVGNPKDFAKPLDSLGKVTPIDLTIPEPKVEAAKVDSASLVKGKQLLQRVQQSVGGADKLAGVKDVRQVAEVQIDPAMGGLKLKQTNQWLSTGRFRQEVEAPFGKLSSFTDGRSGWVRGPQGEGALAGPMLKQAQGEIFRSYFGLMSSDRNPDRTVNYAGPGALDISDQSGNSVRLMVDEATGMPLKTSYPGSQGTIEESWSDLREVDGMKVPFKIKVTQNGKNFAEVTVQELKVNTGITEEQLSKRQ
ncbi:MAG TPA: pitrilysin family protein [Bryobacteraceae bacterium]|jgi:zinc protease|nr:pitrilysin family protein [Bryobacteraceae bacterium]